ncbi:uncharacterized protein LOC134275247 [Saccostrea cucullata]|uniref:uncharacterized protein LOC134275247 n=1 Tax=Saccostrea cuccullata TaxID=36930 RepID=UPI002ED6A3A6
MTEMLDEQRDTTINTGEENEATRSYDFISKFTERTTSSTDESVSELSCSLIRKEEEACLSICIPISTILGLVALLLAILLWYQSRCMKSFKELRETYADVIGRPIRI